MVWFVIRVLYLRNQTYQTKHFRVSAFLSNNFLIIYSGGMEMVQVTPLRRTLASSPNPNAPVAFNVLTLLVGQREGHPACKNGGMVEAGTA